MPLDVDNVFSDRFESVHFARENQLGREERVETNVRSNVVENAVLFNYPSDKALHMRFINAQPESVALRSDHPFLASKRTLKDWDNPTPRQNSERRSGDLANECGSLWRRKSEQL
jgi:hypothetical protein